MGGILGDFYFFHKKVFFLKKKAKKLFAIVNFISKHFSIVLLTLTFGESYEQKRISRSYFKV
jgi:hypothetical protein